MGNHEEPISVDSGSVIRSAMNFNRERGSTYVKLDKTSGEYSKSYDFESIYNNPGEFNDHKTKHDNHFSYLNLDISDD